MVFRDYEDYIYLDWNVVKYMKNHRMKNTAGRIDEYFTAEVFNLNRRKDVIFPYSEAHVKDRASRYKPEYRDEIISDFKFFSRINKSQCVGSIDDGRFGCREKSMVEFFDEYIEEESQNVSIDSISSGWNLHNVDISKVQPNHPYYPIIEKYGCLSEQNVNEYLTSLFFKIFKDNDEYKKLRDYAPELAVNLDEDTIYQIRESSYGRKLYLHLAPFINSFAYDTEQLRQNWKEISKSWFSLNDSPVGLNRLLSQGYVLLDFHPLFSEKLKKNKNTLDNICRDSNHVLYASKAKYFVSEDSETRNKTEFLYGAFDIKTKVVSEEQFLNEYL